MAMRPGGGLLMLGSSVYRRRGYMFRQYRELHGNDLSPDSICWFSPSAVMNPVLPAHVIERALQENAPKARAEFLNIWREDLSDFIPIDVVEGATEFGMFERPWRPGVMYFAACDSAGGTGQDSFTLAIAHKEGDHILIDAVREAKPRFIPAQVIAEYAQLLKSYHVYSVQSDKFAGGFHSSEWTRNGISFVPFEKTTSENYLAVERMSLRADAMTQIAAGLKKLADAARPLYQKLDEGQKHRFMVLVHSGGHEFGHGGWHHNGSRGTERGEGCPGPH